MVEQPMKAAAWAAWPIGLLLTIAYAHAGLLPLPIFVILDAVYVAAVAVVLLRRRFAPFGRRGRCRTSLASMRRCPSSVTLPRRKSATLACDLSAGG
jgi:hypothetical protein